MDVILDKTLHAFENGLILKGKNPTVIGKITKRNDTITEKKQVVLGVNWFVDPKTLTPDTNKHEDQNEDQSEDQSENIQPLYLRISDLNITRDLPSRTQYTLTDTGLYTSVDDASTKDLIQLVVDKRNAVFIVQEDDYSMVEQAIRVGEQLDTLYNAYPIYKQIIQMKNDKTVMMSLLELIFKLDDQNRDDFLMAIGYAGGYKRTLKMIAERILKVAKPESGLNLMTQEQQVEGFIQFSKLVADETEELVTDETLDRIRQSDVYNRITTDLNSHGFGLSKTQQFNTLQSAAYLLGNYGQNILYNLSDMGAGKTLMTVESIFLMDLKRIHDFNRSDDSEALKKQVEAICVPNKNLIAPKLSIKSSWVKTFELFYTVTKVTDEQYTLTFEYEGLSVTSELFISAFTVKSSTLSVEHALPEPKAGREYLIIDEVHQLAERRLTRTRFFAKSIIPSNRYKTFVLSGTLSNLTTREWLNYITFMGIEFNNELLDKKTASELNTEIKTQRTKIRDAIRESADNIEIEQHRSFDVDAFDKPQTTITDGPRSTNKNNVFHFLYSSKVLELTGKERSLEDYLTRGAYDIHFDFSISDTPNFELFYNLVGTCAITAQSTQVAEELFGEQKQQHNADVINTPSPLSTNDLHLLRVLHQITKDHQIYKSPRIATAINDAILNLNDGLSKKNIYDILSKYAATNTKFLTYLSGLELNILEKLQQSNLIMQPDLEASPKFKILQDILTREHNETHLIVVNDFDAMTKLASALNIKSFTKKELKDPLNYQDLLDDLFEKQSIVIVPQMMIKSSLDLVQANRLVQYQLNTEISDIIQTQNRINRIGQTRETKAYYIATDVLQKNIIELFLETYKNIRVAHKGIVELFVDMSSQVNVINDYISKAINQIDANDTVDVTDTDVPCEFDENGIGYLFPIETASDIVSTHQPLDSTVWYDFTNRDKTQGSLLSPTEKAFMHQMVPCVELQVV